MIVHPRRRLSEPSRRLHPPFFRLAPRSGPRMFENAVESLINRAVLDHPTTIFFDVLGQPARLHPRPALPRFGRRRSREALAPNTLQLQP